MARKTAAAQKIPQPERAVVPIGDLAAASYNPRRIAPEALAGLRASMERFGLVQDVVVNRQADGSLRIVGGHQRVTAMRAAGVAEVPVVILSIPESEERALNVALNNPHISGEFTEDLDALLQQIASEEAELYEALRLGELAAVEPEQVEPQEGEDDAPEVQAEAVTRRGDMWLLGGHRILCGDCRDFADVQRLTTGERVNLAFTSPPYASQRKYDESSGFKPIPPDEYVDWFEDVQGNVRAVLAEDGSWFVNIKEHCEDGQRHLYVKDLAIAHVRRWGWRFVDELVWYHRGLPGTWPNRFKNQWEPVFHLAGAASIKFRPSAVGAESDQMFHAGGAVSDTNRTGNVGWHGGDVERVTGVARPGNVIDLPNNPANHGGASHSAAFPIGLPQFFILAFSDAGDVVFDPFMGSGTTLIAAEKTGRAAIGTEISPLYCDVIVRRWQTFTGKAATLDGDGRTFDEVGAERFSG